MDSSSTSSSRRWPRALLLAAALVVAGEASIAAILPVNQGRTQVDDLLAELDSPQEHRDIVLLGDSVTAGAVKASGGDPRIADLSSNQAIGLAGMYFTYRRYIESAGPPEALVLALVPESYENDLRQEYTPTYFESAFLRWGEIRDFAQRTGRSSQALAMAANLVLHPPSMLRRAGVRRAFRGMRPWGGRQVRNLPQRRIAGQDPGVTDGLKKRGGLVTFRASSVSNAYLEAIAMDTSASGTRLILITPALPVSVAEAWRKSGFLSEYSDMQLALASKYPNVSCEPTLQFAQFDDVDMYDPVHLKPGPARAFGRAFLDRVLAVMKETVR